MNTLAFMNLGGPELILILLVILVLFGAKRLPGLARGMGQAIKEFQKSKDEFGAEPDSHEVRPAPLSDRPVVSAPTSSAARSQDAG